MLWKDFDALAIELWHSPDGAREIINSTIEMNQNKATDVLKGAHPWKYLPDALVEAPKELLTLEALKLEFEMNIWVEVVEFVETQFAPDGRLYWKVKLLNMWIVPFYDKQILADFTIEYCDWIKCSEAWYAYWALWMKDWRIVPFKISSKVKYYLLQVKQLQIDNCADLEILSNWFMKWKIRDMGDWKWYEFEWAEILGRVSKSSDIIFKSKDSVAEEIKYEYWIEVDKSDLKIADKLYNCPMYWTIRPVKWWKFPYVWWVLFKEVEWRRIEHVHSIAQEHHHFTCMISIYWWGEREAIIDKKLWKYDIYFNKFI